MTIRLSLKSTGALLGHITPEDLQFLNDQLEEESSTDTDYFIHPSTVDMLEAAGGSAALVSLLRQAVGSSDGVDIVWQEA